MSFGELIKKHAGTILTFIATGTFIATVYKAIEETPKALELIEDARKEKCAELTKFETVQVSAPAYIPAIVLGTLTIGCMFGANILNVKQQASLMSAYAVLDQTYKKHRDKFKKYRDKVADIFGEEADLKVAEAVSHDEYPVPEVEDEEKKYKFKITGIDGEDVYFYATMSDVIAAEYEVNKELNTGCTCSLNYFLEQLGADKITNGDLLGWNITTITYWGGYSWLDFGNNPSVDGDDYDYEIFLNIEPTPGFENYEENLDYMEHKYLDMCYA